MVRRRVRRRRVRRMGRRRFRRGQFRRRGRRTVRFVRSRGGSSRGYGNPTAPGPGTGQAGHTAPRGRPAPRTVRARRGPDRAPRMGRRGPVPPAAPAPPARAAAAGDGRRIAPAAASKSKPNAGSATGGNGLSISDFRSATGSPHDKFGRAPLWIWDKGPKSVITVDFGTDGVRRLMLAVALLKNSERGAANRRPPLLIIVEFWCLPSGGRRLEP